MLLAWLTNNYWMTNFQADQGGRLRFRFWLLPRPARALGEAANEALAYARPPAAHVYAGRGAVRRTAGSLLAAELGPVLLTRLEPSGSGVALTLLNPEDKPAETSIGPGMLRPTRATRTDLAGAPLEELACKDGTFRLTVAPRAWTRVLVELA